MVSTGTDRVRASNSIKEHVHSTEVGTKGLEQLVFPKSAACSRSLWLVSIPISFDNRNTGEANWKQLEDSASRGQGKATVLYGTFLIIPRRKHSVILEFPLSARFASSVGGNLFLRFMANSQEPLFYFKETSMRMWNGNQRANGEWKRLWSQRSLFSPTRPTPKSHPTHSQTPKDCQPHVNTSLWEEWVPISSWNSGSNPIISPALLILFKCLVFFASSLKHHSSLKSSFLDQRCSFRRIVLRMILASPINSSRSVIRYCPERLVEVRCADFWHCVWSKARVNSKDLKQMSTIQEDIAAYLGTLDTVWSVQY